MHPSPLLHSSYMEGSQGLDQSVLGRDQTLCEASHLLVDPRPTGMPCANTQLPCLVIAAAPSPCLFCVVTHWEGEALSEGFCADQCLLHAQLSL